MILTFKSYCACTYSCFAIFFFKYFLLSIFSWAWMHTPIPYVCKCNFPLPLYHMTCSFCPCYSQTWFEFCTISSIGSATESWSSCRSRETFVPVFVKKREHLAEKEWVVFAWWLSTIHSRSQPCLQNYAIRGISHHYVIY